jgi:hypothetical protein
LLDYDGNISEAEIKNGNSQAEVTFWIKNGYIYIVLQSMEIY